MKIGVFKLFMVAFEVAEDHDIIEVWGEVNQAWFNLNKVKIYFSGIASLLIESWSPYKILQNSAGGPRAIQRNLLL
jgi:hypothetical protein